MPYPPRFMSSLRNSQRNIGALGWASAKWVSSRLNSSCNQSKTTPLWNDRVVQKFRSSDSLIVETKALSLFENWPSAVNFGLRILTGLPSPRFSRADTRELLSMDPQCVASLPADVLHAVFQTRMFKRDSEAFEHGIFDLRIRRVSGQRTHLRQRDCLTLIQREAEELHLRARERA